MERSRLVVVSCVDYARVALCRALRHIVGRFQDNGLQVVTAELPCNGAADATRPDYRDIINLSSSRVARLIISSNVAEERSDCDDEFQKQSGRRHS